MAFAAWRLWLPIGVLLVGAAGSLAAWQITRQSGHAPAELARWLLLANLLVTVLTTIVVWQWRQLRLRDFQLRAARSEGTGQDFHSPSLRRSAQVEPQVPESIVAPARPFGRALAGKKVLVLEDRLVDQTIVQRQLRQLGAICTLASDGNTGLEKVGSAVFDCILCDCAMPDMDGFEFTRRLRERERKMGGRIPVIAMTAHASRADMQQCFAAGMDDFVSKPVTLQRLATVLSQWLASKDETIHIGDAAGPEVLDLKIVQQLLGSEDEKMIADVVQEFATAAGESWTDVQGHFARRDSYGLIRAAHGAKGEARNLGAASLGGLYEKLEYIAQRDDFEAAASVISEISLELSRVQNFAARFSERVAR
ncbi:MAG: response regulator [Rhodospirillaceae bacterium]